MWVMKSRGFCGTGTFSVTVWDFPGCIAFTPPPLGEFFLKGEASPLHYLHICCGLTAASGSLDSPFSSILTSTCHPLLTRSMSHSSFLICPLFLSGSGAVMEQAFHRHSHWDQWPHQQAGSWRGSSSSSETNPTHLCIFDSREGRVLKAHRSVESPFSLVSHYQTVPHHRSSRDHAVRLKKRGSRWRKK